MAQTTGAVVQQCAKVEISPNGSSWTDISGATQSWSGMTQARTTGEAYTFDGDTAIVGVGKRTPMDVTFNIVYTETDADAYEVIRTQFENTCGGNYYVKMSPKGGNAGDEELTLYGLINSFTYPEMDASTGDVVMAAFNIYCANITISIIAS